MDIPVVITARLMDVESELESHRHRITALEAERDSLRLAVDVLTKIPDGWKYVEGGAEVMVDQPTSTLVDPARSWGAPLPTKDTHHVGGQIEREPIAVSASPPVLGSKRFSSRRSKKQREILSVLRKLGPTNRHLVAGAIGMKPDLLSQHLSNMKKLKLVAHDPETGIWSAA